MASDFDEQEKRIAQVFEQNEPPEVNAETLSVYQAFLENRLLFPILATGIEDFEWEEFYVLGPGDKNEYVELKKTRPSYTDIFEIFGFLDEPDDRYGILANVRRISDKKKFVVPLGDLEGTEKKSEAAKLIDDYVVWIVNFI